MTQLTYEQYLKEMKDKINELTKKLYNFDPNNLKISQDDRMALSELAQIVLSLGSVSDVLRPYLSNNIPTQYQLLDEWIESMDVEKIKILFSVAFLRYTFVARNNLKNWTSLRDKVALKLDAEGKDSKRILKGLY